MKGDLKGSHEIGDAKKKKKGLSHEIIVTESLLIIVVSAEIVGVGASGDQGGLGLSRLGLLATLVCSLLSLHLFVAESCETTRHLLDLLAGQVLSQLLSELKQESGVVCLLGRRSDDGSQGIAQLLELALGRRVEERKVGNVDSLTGIVGVNDNSSASSMALTSTADTNVAKQVFGVLQVGFLLLTTKTVTTFGLSLLLFRVIILSSERTGSLVLSNALSLGFLISLGLGEGLGLGFVSLLLLLALYLGIFSGVPRIENLG